MEGSIILIPPKKNKRLRQIVAQLPPVDPRLLNPDLNPGNYLHAESFHNSVTLAFVGIQTIRKLLICETFPRRRTAQLLNVCIQVYVLRGYVRAPEIGMTGISRDALSRSLLNMIKYGYLYRYHPGVYIPTEKGITTYLTIVSALRDAISRPFEWD